MSSSNDKDRNRAGLARQASALALTTCRRAVVAFGHDANERFGARKVFLVAVHAALGGEGAIELEAFKRRMVSAHRAGLLVLARADLVAAMPRGPSLPAQSPTAWRSSTSCSTMRRATRGPMPRRVPSPRREGGSDAPLTTWNFV